MLLHPSYGVHQSWLWLPSPSPPSLLAVPWAPSLQQPRAPAMDFSATGAAVPPTALSAAPAPAAPPTALPAAPPAVPQIDELHFLAPRITYSGLLLVAVGLVFALVFINALYWSLSCVWQICVANICMQSKREENNQQHTGQQPLLQPSGSRSDTGAFAGAPSDRGFQGISRRFGRAGRAALIVPLQHSPSSNAVLERGISPYWAWRSMGQISSRRVPATASSVSSPHRLSIAFYLDLEEFEEDQNVSSIESETGRRSTRMDQMQKAPLPVQGLPVFWPTPVCYLTIPAPVLPPDVTELHFLLHGIDATVATPLHTDTYAWIRSAKLFGNRFFGTNGLRVRDVFGLAEPASIFDCPEFVVHVPAELNPWLRESYSIVRTLDRLGSTERPGKGQLVLLPAPPARRPGMQAPDQHEPDSGALSA